MADKITQAFAHEVITVSTAAIGPTILTMHPQTSGTRCAHVGFFSVEDDEVRFRFDGTDPTSTTGHRVTAGSNIEIVGGSNLKRLKFIRSGAGDAKVRATYSK